LESPPVGTPSLIGKSNASSNQRLESLLCEKYLRRREPLNIYRPLAGQRAFHESDAFVRLAVGSNRSGKSLVSCVEFARCVLNRDPFNKYPKRGMVYVVGKSLFHLADTIYQKLRKPGFFNIVPNDQGEWEVFQPWNPAHVAKEHLVRPSDPLIPSRFIEVESFDNKAQGEITYVKFTTGWEARFFSARGLLPQGSPADVAWLDEEIVDSQDGPWVPELLVRLTDRGGRMIWSATPQNGFANLLEMSDKADRQLEVWQSNPVDNPKPDVVRFDLKLEENRYQKKKNVDRLRRNLSDDEVMVRFAGTSMANSIKMYPQYSLTVHGIQAIGKYNFVTPPQHWTRYAVIDPGHSICAVLFFTVPPEEECPGKMPCVIAFKELYIPQCNAMMFAEGMEAKTMGDQYQTFIIDGHGARPRDAGSGVSIEEQYSLALQSRGVRSVETGSGFIYGNDDRRGGVLKVHEYLMERNGGRPRFLIACDPEDPMQPLCPMLHYEMRRYRKKRSNGIVLEEGDDRGPTHLVQCVRYMCSFNPVWVERAYSSKGFRAFNWIKDFVHNTNQSASNSPAVNFGRG